MDVNENALPLIKRVALNVIASKLAPTRMIFCFDAQIVVKIM
jgi:hypothetical protein